METRDIDHYSCESCLVPIPEAAVIEFDGEYLCPACARATAARLRSEPGEDAENARDLAELAKDLERAARDAEAVLQRMYGGPR